MRLATSRRGLAALPGFLLCILVAAPVGADATSPDRNALLVAEGLSLPVEAVTRVTRCNLGRMRPDGRADAVDSCYLAVLKDKLLVLRLQDKKPARFETLLAMPFAEITGLALFERTPAQLQIHYRDDIYGVDVLSNLLFRDGKRLLAVFQDLKAAGLPLVEPVDWIQTMPNPGVPFTINVG